MLIALMSDSHDNMPALHRAVQFCNDRHVDHVLHAGDLVAPFVNRALKNLKAPITIVFGNNDGERHGLRTMFEGKIFDPPHELTLDGKRVLMLHAPILLETLRQSKKYDLILYGHLHEIEVSEEPTLVVNPGEVGGWLSGKSTLALWNTDSNEVQIVEI